jgi:hypothetical protein
MEMLLNISYCGGINPYTPTVRLGLAQISGRPMTRMTRGPVDLLGVPCKEGKQTLKSSKIRVG